MNTSSHKLKVGIIGLGMVGGPLKRWFEEGGRVRGVDLFCFDTDPAKGYRDNVNKADYIFLTVPTPSRNDGSCDTSIVENCVQSIEDGRIIVIKSTVVPGTTEILQAKYPRKRLLFNPEFLTEKRAWEDFINPSRQLVGHTQVSKGDAVAILNLLPRGNFTRPWETHNAYYNITSTEAELIKYLSNVFGYIKVVFGNMMADICHSINLAMTLDMGISLSVDYGNIKEVVGADLRIGEAWLDVDHGAYCGAGGYCFPKDMNAFIVFLEKLKDEVLPKGIGLITRLQLDNCISILKVIREYNDDLIEHQGLTMKEVSRHIDEVTLKKIKKIRS